MIVANYSKSVFDVTDMNAAKRIILTPELGLTTDQRWEKETPYLLGLMERLNLDSSSVVLDFGCGIGRLSKAVIDKYGCSAIGVDISTNMRALAQVYVNNDKFFSMSSEGFKFFQNSVDMVIAVWALQHVRDLTEEIARIESVLKPGGKLFVVNERRRFIPTDQGWIDDSADIFIELQKKFKAIEINTMDPAIVTDDVTKRTFWGIFSKQDE